MQGENFVFPDKPQSDMRPKIGKIGVVRRTDNKKVLTVDTDDKKVKFDTESKGNKQSWTQEFNGNYFSLKNTETGLYLTATDDGELIVQAKTNWTIPSGGVKGVIRNENEKKVLEVNEGKF